MMCIRTLITIGYQVGFGCLQVIQLVFTENVTTVLSMHLMLLALQFLLTISAFGCCALQAANYGVPQSRRRMIIVACAPGEKLPGGFIDGYEIGWPLW